MNKKNLRITEGAVCGIGSFDGVHKGHRAIVKMLRSYAGNTKAVGIITFWPLPFVALGRAPAVYLTLKEEKEDIFNSLGVDFIYYFPFTPELARLRPEGFVRLVGEQIAPSAVVVGENFHFGRNRQGSANQLVKFAGDSFTVHVIEKVAEHGTISSTRIRELLLLGKVDLANSLLEQPYVLTGLVKKGKGKGAKIGFPTINIAVPSEKLLPLDGVYEVEVKSRGGTHQGAMFLRHDVVEVHIIGYSGNLYRCAVKVRILHRLRAVADFPDDAALKDAIARDIRNIVEKKQPEVSS